MMNNIQLKDVVAGALALIVTLTMCLIFIYETVNARPYNIPSVLENGFFAIVAFFLGGHAVTNGARAAGVAAAQTAANLSIAASASKLNAPSS
jgi:hypothetical protein